MTQWMVRTAENELLGPMPEETLKERIVQGLFDPSDEVCSGSGYWFSLNEDDELKKHLGVAFPRVFSADDEPTEGELSGLRTDPTLTKTDPLVSANTQAQLNQDVQEMTKIEGPTIWKTLSIVLGFAVAIVLYLMWDLIRPLR